MLHGFGGSRCHRHVMGTGVNPPLHEDSAGPRFGPDSSVCQLTGDRGVRRQSARTSNPLDTGVDWSTMRLLSNRYPFADTSETYRGFLNSRTCQPATPLQYYRQTSYADNQHFHNQPFPVSSVEIFPHPVFANVENAAKRRWSDENGNTLPSAGGPVTVGCLPRQVARQLPVYSSVSSTPMTFTAVAEHSSVDRDFTWMPKLFNRCSAGQESSSVTGNGNAANLNDQRLFTDVPSTIASTPSCFPQQSNSTTDLHAQGYDVTDAGQTSLECKSSFPPYQQAEFSRPLSDVSPNSALSAVPVKGRWYFGSDISAASSAVGFEDAVTTNSSFNSPPALPPNSLQNSTSARPELLPLSALHCGVRKHLPIKSQEQGSKQLNDECDQQHLRQRTSGTVLEYSDDDDFDDNDDDNKLTPKQIRQRKFQFGSRPTAASMSIGKTRTREKYRTVYNERQKLQLEADYVLNTYITADGKAAIARKTGLSERQVKIWFQNRRAKDRRMRHRRNTQNCTSTTTSPETAGSICLSTSDSTLPVTLDYGC